MSRKKNSDRKVTVPTAPTDQQLQERFVAKCLHLGEHFGDLLTLLTQSVLKGILLGGMIDALETEFQGQGKLYHYKGEFHKAIEEHSRIAPSTTYMFQQLKANEAAIMEKMKTKPLLTMKEALSIEEPVKPKRPRKSKTGGKDKPAPPTTPPTGETTAQPTVAVPSPSDGIQAPSDGIQADTHHADDLSQLDARLLNAVMDLFERAHITDIAPVKLPIGTVITAGAAVITVVAGQAIVIVPIKKGP